MPISPSRMNGLTRRQFTSGALGVLAALQVSKAFAQAKKFEGRQLVASTFGGKSQEVFQPDIFDWLASETGAQVTGVPLLSAQAFARMKAEAAGPQIDTFAFSGGQETAAKQEGLTRPLEGVSHMEKLPSNLRDPDGHWVSWGVIAEGILYRTDKIQTPPTSYLDLLRPEYKGHVAFPHITNGYGTDFLVMLARANGGDENNIDPGFEAMKQIGNASIFRAAADVQTQFAQNDIWLMPYDAASGIVSAQMGLPVAFAPCKEGVPSVLMTACVTKNTSNADVADVYIDRLLDPGVQLALAKTVGWAPTNPEAVLPPELVNSFPKLEQMISLDRAAIAANRAAWTERWNKEIVQ